MKRTEVIQFRVRPEMKKGLKMMFYGQKYSDSFEHLINGYIGLQIKRAKDEVAALEDALKDYRESENFRKSVEDMMIYNLDLQKRTIEKYREVSEVCFPGGMMEGENNPNDPFFGYEK